MQIISCTLSRLLHERFCFQASISLVEFETGIGEPAFWDLLEDNLIRVPSYIEEKGNDGDREAADVVSCLQASEKLSEQHTRLECSGTQGCGDKMEAESPSISRSHKSCARRVVPSKEHFN